MSWLLMSDRDGNIGVGHAVMTPDRARDFIRRVQQALNEEPAHD